jgi:hypothetical protein
MSGSGRGKRFGRSIGKNEDPLACLDQIDVGDSLPLEEEALVLMVKMLDDIEAFDELSINLRSIMAEDILVETRIISLFRALIHGAQVEHNYLRMKLLT